MKDFSILMALVDFIPVLFFAAATVILIRDLYNKMSKGSFALFAAGTFDVICAGALKAVYKLLYAMGVCDFDALNTIFFPLQSIGFLLAGLGILAMLCHKQTRGTTTLAAIAPPVFRGTFVFVGLMITGLGLIDAGLCILSVKLKKPALIALFVVSFLCSLCMGYLSSRNFDGALMNWIAQGVNIVGQGTFFAGALLLHKNKFEDLHLHGGEIA